MKTRYLLEITDGYSLLLELAQEGGQTTLQRAVEVRPHLKPDLAAKEVREVFADLGEAEIEPLVLADPMVAQAGVPAGGEAELRASFGERLGVDGSEVLCSLFDGRTGEEKAPEGGVGSDTLVVGASLSEWEGILGRLETWGGRVGAPRCGLAASLGGLAGYARERSLRPTAVLSLGRERSHLAMVTVEGVLGLRGLEVGYHSLVSRIQQELKLKFPGSASKLLHEGVYDFSEMADALLAPVLAAVKEALSAAAGGLTLKHIVCLQVPAAKSWVDLGLSRGLGMEPFPWNLEDCLRQHSLRLAHADASALFSPGQLGLLAAAGSPAGSWALPLRADWSDFKPAGPVRVVPKPEVVPVKPASGPAKPVPEPAAASPEARKAAEEPAKPEPGPAKASPPGAGAGGPGGAVPAPAKGSAKSEAEERPDPSKVGPPEAKVTLQPGPSQPPEGVPSRPPMKPTIFVTPSMRQAADSRKAGPTTPPRPNLTRPFVSVTKTPGVPPTEAAGESEAVAAPDAPGGDPKPKAEKAVTPATVTPAAGSALPKESKPSAPAPAVPVETKPVEAPQPPAAPVAPKAAGAPDRAPAKGVDPAGGPKASTGADAKSVPSGPASGQPSPPPAAAPQEGAKPTEKPGATPVPPAKPVAGKGPPPKGLPGKPLGAKGAPLKSDPPKAQPVQAAAKTQPVPAKQAPVPGSPPASKPAPGEASSAKPATPQPAAASPSPEAEKKPASKRGWMMIAAGVLLLVGLVVFLVLRPESGRDLKPQELAGVMASKAPSPAEEAAERQRAAEAEARRVAEEEARRAEEEAQALREAEEEAARLAELERIEAERIRLEQARGSIAVDSTPTGAEVYLGADLMGRTPLVIPDLKLGLQTLTIQAAGYDPATLEVPVGEDEVSRVEAILVSRMGRLEVSTDPPSVPFALFSAGILMEGEGEAASGISPATVPDLMPGDYRLEIRREGWPQVTAEVRVEPKETATYSYTFRPGVLRLTSVPSGAEAWKGEQSLGRTPLALEDLPPGRIALTLKLEGHEETEVQGEVEAGEELALKAQLVSYDRVFLASELDDLPKVTRGPEPLRPFELRGVAGRVRVRLLVDERGQTSEIQIMESTDLRFNPGVVDALSQWVFEPAKRKDRAVKTIVEFTFDFSRG